MGNDRALTDARYTGDGRSDEGGRVIANTTAEPLYYHGRRGPANFVEGRPAFFTTDRTGARWYAHERGDFALEPRIHTARLHVHHPAGPDDLDAVIAAIGATADDVVAHSPYDGDNPHDFLYVPTIRDELEQQGFDGYRGWDVLTNGEIPITVPFFTWQVELIGGADGEPV